MLKKILIIFFVCFIIDKGAFAAGLYVDYENGLDSNAGTIQAPLKTVSKAKELAKTSKKNQNSDFYIYLKGGQYHIIDSKLTFYNADSGYNNKNIIYTSYDGTAVLSGGVVIEGWEKDASTGIYSAQIPADLVSRQMFVNGIRAQRAATEEKLSDFSVTSTGFTTSSSLLYNVASGARDDVELIFNYAFMQQRAKVSSVSASSNTSSGVTYDVKVNNTTSVWSNIYNDIKSTYASIGITPVRIENAKEFLDEPGEFYIDHDNDVVYYIPREFENMSEAEVIIPKLERMLTFSGGASSPVSNIRFENVEFAYTTWSHPTAAGLYEIQNNILANTESEVAGYSHTTNSSIWIQYANNIDFVNCKFHKLGTAGVLMSRGADNCDFVGNEFYDISGTALTVGSSNYANDALFTNAHDIIENTTVKNNYFHDLPAEYQGGSMLTVGFPQGVDITGNEFYNAPYSGIHIGMGWAASWDYDNSVRYKPTAMKDINISSNHFKNMLNVLYDGGAIYTVGRTGYTDGVEYNTITRNYITDVNHTGGAIYHDEGSNGWCDEENVVDLLSSPKTQSHIARGPERAAWINNHIVSGKMPSGIHCIQKNNYTSTPLFYSDSYGFIMGTRNSVKDIEAKKIIAEAGLFKNLEKRYTGLQDFELEAYEYNLKKGGTATVKLTNILSFKDKKLNITPEVYYESGNTAVATVSSAGKITAVGTGSTYIKVCIIDGEILRTKEVMVTVS